MSQKKSLLQSKLFTILSTLLIISLSIFIFGMIYQNELPKLVEEINNSTIGGILTAIITVFLLQGQTATEEERDKNLSVFEKKQEVFHNFLEKLKAIIMDGEIKIAQYGENTDLGENIDELKELLFELGYIQMHTSEENTKQIFQEVALIMQILSDFSNEGNRKQQELPNFYGKLSEHLFKIVSILKNDLYGIQTNTIGMEQVTNLLKECGLYIEQQEMDKKEVQNYFWDKLQDEFIARGYQIQKRSFEKDVVEFYVPKGKNRHRFYGIDVPIYTTKEGRIINFCIEIEKGYYYGIRRNGQEDQNPTLQKWVNDVGGLAKTNWWYGWKYPSEEYQLDFLNLDSKAFSRLKNPRQRENLIRNIVDEMELYIKRFTEIAEISES